MSVISTLIDLVLHLDKHLAWVIDKFGAWSYLIIFLIIFFETGLVFTPFLPGDSLLFAVGAFSALGSLNVWLFFLLLSIAAIVGDSVNYSIGHFLGKKILAMKSKFIKKEYIDKTQHFYDKYGAKTIVIARFIPIVRTFAPFLAGLGAMNYFKFLSYNIIGGILWVAVFVFGGFFFGNIPLVKENFTIAILIIIAISFIPVVIEVVRHYRQKKKA
ncbi:DedA family protein [Candidatus Woesearchaeota archaeon]|nr:DedA family protein [Candidatus Woesearchaeota archaeon]